MSAAPLPVRAVASRTGDIGLGIVEFEGAHRIPNRDATGFYFGVRLGPTKLQSRLAVLFSGTTLLAQPEHFHLPDLGSRDTNFIEFAYAAIGDYLDENGLPPPKEDAGPTPQIECFSPRMTQWLEREEADDTTVLAYVSAQTYWSWKFGCSQARISSGDLLRLGTSLDNVNRILQLEDGHLWTHRPAQGASLEVTWLPEFLRQQQGARESTSQVALLRPEPEPAAPPPAPTVKAVARSRKRRKSARRAKNATTMAEFVYVDEARLADLRALQVPSFDFRRLVALCDELNTCYRSQCYFAVAALTRAVLDHVPPVFSLRTFAEVASSHGGRSFKEQMQHLERSARKIADANLHTQIRGKETVPTRTQVNFSNDLDVLLAEIIRHLS